MMGLRFLVVLAVAAVPAVLCSGQPEVTIEQGVVRGLYRTTAGNRVYSSFEGIPFAEPPQGKHRFKEPSPAKPWLGIYNATREPPKCLQINFLMPSIQNGSAIGNEDCLYINVYTPKLPTGAKGEKPLDVLAFIHGGAFALLHGTAHDPKRLLDRDVVLVTFNYRLGVLGFLSTEDDVVPGNNGMKDQVLALKWIQKNIAHFGGNPNSVTIGGLSAGGASCHLHTISPLSKGLFKGAICMSGVALNPWVIAKNSRSSAAATANQLGCPTEDTKLMVKCLRDRPAEHVVHATKIFSSGVFPSLVFTPVIEPSSPGAFISSNPGEIIKQKGAMDIPILLTYTSEEGAGIAGAIISSPETFNGFVAEWDNIFPTLIGLDPSLPPEKKLSYAKKIKEYYKIDNSTEGAKNLIKLLGDVSFETGIGATAKLLGSISSSPIYVGRFSYRGQHSFTELFTKEDWGVSHGDDFIYVFGSPIEGAKQISTESDLQMSKTMIDLIVSFAANGSLGEGWQPVNKHLPQIAYTDIRGPNDLKKVVADGIGEEKFWNSLMTTDSVHSEL